jgi:tryptophan synthase alpha subunit
MLFPILPARSVFAPIGPSVSFYLLIFFVAQADGLSVFVTFVTGGFPTKDATVPLMLALEAGGADIIELGMPFSDPIADGPTIQEANTVRLFGASCAYLIYG